MKLLLVFTLLVKKYEGGHYTLGDKNFEAYFQSFDEIMLLPRQIESCTNASGITGLTRIPDSVAYLSLDSDDLNTDYIFNQKKLKKKIREAVAQCDVALIHMPSVIGHFVITASNKLGKPYILKIGGCPWDILWNHSLKGKVAAPFMWLMTRLDVRQAPYAFYVTQKFLQERYPCKGMTSSFSGVVLKEVGDGWLSQRQEKINSNGDKQLIIGTTAAVYVRYKGQQYIIKALGKMKKAGDTSYKYQLAGGGNQDYLKSVAKRYDVAGQVEFLGALPHDKVFEWLNSIDVYAQPSRTEGMPRSLIEAMSRALPACGTDAGGIPELLQTDYLFSKKKSCVDEIVAILKKMKSPQIRMEQAKRNFGEAKKYQRDVIDARRREYFDMVKKDIQEKEWPLL